MISTILLLINLNFCCCGTFEVNVTQTSYQAEETDDITLEWTFTTKTRSFLDSLCVHCRLLTELKSSCLLHLHEGVEVSECQDEQFAGRFQWDKDVLREGRIRLYVSRLRINDSGLYLCVVRTKDGANSGKCWLSVTAAADELKPQRPTVSPQPESPRPESRGRIGLYCALGLTAAALLAVCARLCFVRGFVLRNLLIRQRESGPLWHWILSPCLSMRLLFPARRDRPLTSSLLSLLSCTERNQTSNLHRGKISTVSSTGRKMQPDQTGSCGTGSSSSAGPGVSPAVILVMFCSTAHTATSLGAEV